MSCYAQSIKHIKKVEFISKNAENVIVKLFLGMGINYKGEYGPTFSFILVRGENINYSKYKVDTIAYCVLTHEKDNAARWTGRKNACDTVGEENVAKAERLLSKQIRGLNLLVEKGKLHPAYAPMAEKVAEIVKAYKEDFTFADAKLLGEYNPTIFMWCVRTCGTDIYLEKTEFTMGWLKESLNHRTRSGSDQKYYLWDGKVLCEIREEDVMECANYHLPVKLPLDS